MGEIRRILDDRKRIFRLFAAALTAALLCAFASGTVTGHASSPERKAARYESVRIHGGDSLWSIAEEYGGGGDTAAYVEELKSLNGLTSDAITAGSYLVVPVAAGS